MSRPQGLRGGDPATGLHPAGESRADRRHARPLRMAQAAPKETPAPQAPAPKASPAASAPSVRHGPELIDLVVVVRPFGFVQVDDGPRSATRWRGTTQADPGPPSLHRHLRRLRPERANGGARVAAGRRCRSSRPRARRWCRSADFPMTPGCASEPPSARWPKRKRRLSASKPRLEDRPRCGTWSSTRSLWVAPCWPMARGAIDPGKATLVERGAP